MEIPELKRAHVLAKLKSYKLSHPLFISLGFIIVIVLMQLVYVQNLRANNTEKTKNQLSKLLNKTEMTLHSIQQEDQYKKNMALEEEIKNIQKTYKNAVLTYEDLLSASGTKPDEKLLTIFAKSLTQLSERRYASSEATLYILNGEISKLKAVSNDTTTIAQNVPANNTPPSAGYSRQQVQSDVGAFLVDIISADLGSTRVIIDTASDSDCRNDCPVLSLGDYVSRSGGFAGVNGSYFCPATYPSCSGKTNSFDTLLMNKNKHYLNSDNNVYSTVPAAIFLGSSVRYVSQSLEWGRDTGVDGVIANQPLLLVGGNIVFGGGTDPKQGSKGSRSFVGSKGSTVYIGVVHNVTVAEMAHVLKTLGFEGALNLDSGGSTALWSGGYKVGPGRNIPNAIVFVRK